MVESGVESGVGSVLGRADPATAGFADEGRTLRVLPDLAVGKVRILSEGVEADFKKAFGVEPPAPRRQIERNGVTIAWMAPGEWVLTGDRDAVTAALAEVNAAVPDLGFAIDVGHGRTCFELGGMAARDAIASVCGLDVRDAQFTVDSTARTTLGATGMFIARLGDRDGAPLFRIVVDQTMAAYAARMLRQPGRNQDIVS